MLKPARLALAGFAAFAALAGTALVGCGGSSSAALDAPADTVTVDSSSEDYSDTTDYSSEDYSDTTDYSSEDYSSDSSDAYSNASGVYSDYIARFNNSSLVQQVTQSLAMAAKQLPMGDGELYCRIGMSTQYPGAVIIAVYLPIGSGMSFMVPDSGTPVIQDDFTTPPTTGDPCSVSSSGQVSF